MFTGQAAPIDLTSMNFVARAADLSLPTLILHSDDDGFVPSTASITGSKRSGTSSGRCNIPSRDSLMAPE